MIGEWLLERADAGDVAEVVELGKYLVGEGWLVTVLVDYRRDSSLIILGYLDDGRPLAERQLELEV